MARGRRPKDPGPKMAAFWDAPEARILAQDIIPVVHTHLMGKPITYVFCAKNPKGGKAAATMSIVGGVNAALAQGLEASQIPIEGNDRFFLMRIGMPAWRHMTPDQKRALVDHELCHGGINDKGGLCLYEHDVEEFRAIIDRHGFWRHEVRKFAEACAAADDGQQALPLDPAADAPEEAPAANGGEHPASTRGRRRNGGVSATVLYEGERADAASPEGEALMGRFVEDAIGGSAPQAPN